MTSSLVGSEMCIRDSKCCWRARAGSGMASTNVSGKWGEASATRVGASEPVSYTHLTLPTICSV
eukprot:1386631-Prorocentrum_lima.AAC.1